MREGLLYGDQFAEYDALPREIVRRANYTDTADTGDDYLCSMSYAVDTDGTIYVTDLVYSREGMEVTEGLVADLLLRSDTRTAAVESNNGGRGFARAVQRLVPAVRVEWFHQSANKEARILSNSATVLHTLRMPRGWNLRWPELYAHLTTYRRQFRANRWHDAADVVTGVVEREVGGGRRGQCRALSFLTRREGRSTATGTNNAGLVEKRGPHRFYGNVNSPRPCRRPRSRGGPNRAGSAPPP